MQPQGSQQEHIVAGHRDCCFGNVQA